MDGVVQVAKIDFPVQGKGGKASKTKMKQNILVEIQDILSRNRSVPGNMITIINMIVYIRTDGPVINRRGIQLLYKMFPRVALVRSLKALF